MGAGDTSTEESGTKPGAGDTSTEGSGLGKENGWAEAAGPGLGAHVRPQGQQEGGAKEGQAAAAEGPRGINEKGWLIGGQLGENDRGQVAAVVEKNRDMFAFSLEEIGQFKLFEVELKLK
jgi:hypothetical protein